MPTAFRRRPRHSNSLKDIGRLLGTASMIYENRKERLVSHAKYFVHPRRGLHALDVRLRMMNLELGGTGFSVTTDDLSLIDQYCPGMLLDMIDAGDTDRLKRSPIAPETGVSPEPPTPLRDPAIEDKVRGWSGEPRSKLLSRAALQLLHSNRQKRQVEPEDRQVNASRGKRHAEIERQRSGDIDWLKLEDEIKRIASDKRWPWRARQEDPNLRPLRPKLDEELARFVPCADPYWGPVVVEAERNWLEALDATETKVALDFDVHPPQKSATASTIAGGSVWQRVTPRSSRQIPTETIAALEADVHPPQKSAILKRVDRDRATLNSDTMRLRIEAIGQLRIDRSQVWKPKYKAFDIERSWQEMYVALRDMDPKERARLYWEWRERGNTDKKPRKRFREISRASARSGAVFDVNDGLNISFRDIDDEDLDRENIDEDSFDFGSNKSDDGTRDRSDDEDLDDEATLDAEEAEEEDLDDEGSTHRGLAYRNRRRKGRSRGPASDIRLLDPLIYYDPTFYVVIGTIPFKPGKEPVLPQGKWRPKPIDPALFDPNEDYRRPLRAIWLDTPAAA